MLKSVRIENYRSISDIVLDCDDLTVLVGANGSGKSSLLRAIEMFGVKSPEVTAEDYYNGQTSMAIRITATFYNVSDAIKNKYEEYVVDNNLEVVRVLEWDKDKHKSKSTYHGKKPQNSAFDSIRTMNSAEAKVEYDRLRQMLEYRDLPECAKLSGIMDHLSEWERINHKKCTMMEDDGKTFKYNRGFPDLFVRFVYVKPVRDASEDAQEDKDSALADLMELAVRRSIMENEDIQSFTEKAQEQYADLLRSIEQRELGDLGRSMTKTVNKFAPGAKVELSWNTISLDTSLPPAKITLVEDRYRAEVSRAGHGLQRIFTMCILQHLSEAKASEAGNGGNKLPEMVLMIDEPELYQHPNRQRHMSSVLHKLAEGSLLGAPNSMQIIYSTHSPHFVGIDRLDHIRLIRKTAVRSDDPNVTRTSNTSIARVKDKLASIPEYGAKQVQNLELILQTIMTPMINEGFFADLAVLVEGEKDRAALVATAESMEHQLEELGVSVIPCGGKNNLVKIASVFQQLAIPLYCVWDTDYNKEGENLNPVLLSVMERPSEDQPSIAYDTHACFDSELEDVIKSCLGNKYNEYKQKCMTDLCLKKYDSQPHAISYIIRIAMKDNVTFPVFEDIILNVVKQCPDSVA